MDPISSRLRAPKPFRIAAIGALSVAVLGACSTPPSGPYVEPAGSFSEPAPVPSLEGELRTTFSEYEESGLLWRSGSIGAVHEVATNEGYDSGRCLVTTGRVTIAGWSEYERLEPAERALSVAFARADGSLVTTGDATAACDVATIHDVTGSYDPWMAVPLATIAEPGITSSENYVAVTYLVADEEPTYALLGNPAHMTSESVHDDVSVYAFAIVDPAQDDLLEALNRQQELPD